MTLKTADYVFTHTKVTGWRELRKWIVSFGIRVVGQSKGEPPTWANHVAVVLGRLDWWIDWCRRNDVECCVAGDPRDYVLAEALGQRGFVLTLLRERYADTRRFGVRVARRGDLTDDQRERVIRRCLELRGRKYGHAKIIGHAADYALTQFWNACGGKGDVYAFRWLCRMERYPMCSWAGANIAKHAGFAFKKREELAQPDDLYDECAAGPPWEMWAVKFAEGA